MELLCHSAREWINHRNFSSNDIIIDLIQKSTADKNFFRFSTISSNLQQSHCENAMQKHDFLTTQLQLQKKQVDFYNMLCYFIQWYFAFIISRSWSNFKMINKNFAQKCTLAVSLFLLVFAAGCSTRYGHDYIENEVIRAERPQYKNQKIQCTQYQNQLTLKLSCQKVLQDCKYSYRLGERRFQKDFSAYSPEDKKVCFPFLTFFPCVTWGTKMFRADDNSDSIFQVWGPLLKQAVVFNSILACGDVLYYCGSVCWSVGAVPIHYLVTRSAKEVDTYRPNRPGFFTELMGKPVVNLFFPGYVRPDKNPGPMLVQEEMYPHPQLVSKTLHKEAVYTESQDIRAGTQVTISFRGKTYKTKVAPNGKITLPFKIHPLPEHREKLIIQLDAYKTNYSSKPVDFKLEHSFNTTELLTPAQKNLWATVKDRKQNLGARFRACKSLKAFFAPEEFRKFETKSAEYINSLSK